MSKNNRKYVIELESLKDGLNFLFASSGPPLRMAAGTRANPSVIPVTSEQFKALAYDIEGHACGKFGAPLDIQIWVRDTGSGERERLTFEEARSFVESGVPSDDAAAELQAQAEAARAAAAKDSPAPLAAGEGGFSPVDKLIES
jgi:hypothetical protein